MFADTRLPLLPHLRLSLLALSLPRASVLFWLWLLRHLCVPRLGLLARAYCLPPSRQLSLAAAPLRRLVLPHWLLLATLTGLRRW